MPAAPATRFDMDRTALGALLDGEPRYRVDQVWAGLHEGRELADITSLPKALRTRLTNEPALTPALRPVHRSVSDGGDTVKWLWELEDGYRIETVLMHYPERTTVCVSTQAGCAMACGFCATGQAGFDRQLSAGEIIEQVVRAKVEAAAGAMDGRPRRLGNVVFMGMGEPLANFDATWTAVERIHKDLGLSARHLTISTVGVVPGIEQLATKTLPVTLAVSLHSANDADRNMLVPINKRYPIVRLMAACRTWRASRNRRLTFEWAMIEGRNDRDRDAHELAALARPLGAHINLIPLNRTPGFPTKGSQRNRVRHFAALLEDLRVNATVRHTRGLEIDAACGQLRDTLKSQGVVPNTPGQLRDSGL